MGDRARPILASMLGLIALSVVDGARGPSKEVPAGEVLAKNEAVLPEEFDNCTIEGDLKLRW